MKDFALLMGAGEKGEHLFDVGHYRRAKNSSRSRAYDTQSSQADDAGRAPGARSGKRNPSYEQMESVTKSRVSFLRPNASQSHNTQPKSRERRERPSRSQLNQTSMESLHTRTLKCAQDLDIDESMEQLNSKVDQSIERAYLTKQAKAVRAKEINHDLAERVAKINEEKE